MFCYNLLYNCLYMIHMDTHTFSIEISTVALTFLQSRIHDDNWDWILMTRAHLLLCHVVCWNFASLDIHFIRPRVAKHTFWSCPCFHYWISLSPCDQITAHLDAVQEFNKSDVDQFICLCWCLNLVPFLTNDSQYLQGWCPHIISWKYILDLNWLSEGMY